MKMRNTVHGFCIIMMLSMACIRAGDEEGNKNHAKTSGQIVITHPDNDLNRMELNMQPQQSVSMPSMRAKIIGGTVFVSTAVVMAVCVKLS